MRRAVVSLVAVGALALPASAQGPGGQAVDDGCGDAPVLAAGGTTLVPAEPQYDIAALEVGDLLVDGEPRGAVVTLDLCGDVPDGDTAGGWSVSWSLPGDCRAEVRVLESRRVGEDGTSAQHAAEAQVVCPEDAGDLGLGGQAQRGVVRLDPSAFSVDGGSVVWRLRRGTLGPLEDLVRPGAVVAGATGRANSRASFGAVLVGSQVRLGTAGTADDTAAAPDHVLG